MAFDRLILDKDIGRVPFEFLEKSDNYNILVGDLGKCISLTGAIDKLFVLPNCDISYIGSRIRCFVEGTANLNINPYSGGSINGLKNLISKHQYAWVEFVLIGANTWLIYSNSKKYSQYNYGSWHLLPDPVSGYSCVKEIRVDKSGISGSANITNFPLTFNSTHNDFKTIGNGGYVTDGNGYDIIFTDSDGITQLDHEIEKYVDTTGEFVAHVKIPILYYDRVTTIYIHYGNAAISTSQENITDVWSSHYIAVYHLNEDFDDSTINANNGVNQGTGDISGIIAHGRTFSDDYIQIDAVVNDIDVAQGTISTWVNLDSVAEDQQLWQFYTDASNQIYAKYLNSSGVLRIGRAAGTLGPTLWVHAAPILNGQTYIFDILEYHDEIYAGTASGGCLFKWNGVDAWIQKAPLLGSQTEVQDIIVFNDKIYGTTEAAGVGGCLLEWNGINAWAYKATTYLSQTSVQTTVVYNNELYAGTVPNGYLFKWNGVNAWVQVAPQLGGQYILSLCVFNNKIYGGAGGPLGSELFEWNGVNAWVRVAPQASGQSNIRALCIFNNKLYGSTDPNGILLEWNGVNAWVQVAPQLGTEIGIFSLVVYNNELYGGTKPNAMLYKWNGVNAWVQIVDSPSSNIVWSLLVFNDKIYGAASANGVLLEYTPVPGIVDKYIDVNITEGSSTFKKIALTWDISADEIIVYVDGEQEGTIQTGNASHVGSLNASANIGATYNELLSWDGDIDEFRISDIVRSADWERTEFNNQNDTSTFYILS